MTSEPVDDGILNSWFFCPLPYLVGFVATPPRTTSCDYILLHRNPPFSEPTWETPYDPRLAARSTSPQPRPHPYTGHDLNRMMITSDIGIRESESRHPLSLSNE